VNSLFSKMMTAICLKLGTNGVGVGDGMEVSSGVLAVVEMEVGIGVGVTKFVGAACSVRLGIGGSRLVQAVRTITHTSQNRFISFTSFTPANHARPAGVQTPPAVHQPS